jgi:phenylpropionate dioxygenase-like ring-hydroxylating dioxygenase large terminal subunit
MFIYNNWFVAALDNEVTSTRPLARMICGKPIVMYRTTSGNVAALEDRCMHRGMPLSEGKVCDEGRSIMCPYHGLEYDHTGACVKVPSQASIPRMMKVTTYPVVERYNFVWLWPGDPALADPATIPVLPYAENPDFELFNLAHIEYKSDWQLVYDNVMDLTHLAYVHQAAINGDPAANVASRLEVTTDEDANRVRFKRETPNSEPPPQYKFGYPFEGKIDRWQDVECSPSGMLFWSGGLDVGKGAFDGKREGGMQLGTFHAVTPSTEGHCHYFAHGARNVHKGNEAVAAKLRDGMNATLDEDRAIIELQQARLNATSGRPVVSLAADAAGLQVRRMFKRLKAAEAETFPVSVVRHVDLMRELGGAG